MKAILQADMYIKERVNVFSGDTGDIIGWIENLKAQPVGAQPAEFRTQEAAINYILSTIKPTEEKKKVNTNQQSLF
jgi:hypothetical protein